MSIREQIDEHVKSHELELLQPLMKNEEIKRCVYVTKDVLQLVHADAALSAKFQLVGIKTRSVLDSFSTGKRMTFSMDPHNKRTDCIIARTSPTTNGIISFRIRDPKPQLRLFGGMATKDVFIALVWRERNLIGNMFSQNVRNAMLEWKRLFPEYTPVTSEAADDYFSGNVSL